VVATLQLTKAGVKKQIHKKTGREASCLTCPWLGADLKLVYASFDTGNKRQVHTFSSCAE
jgi:hypothetical protein